ncbi:MAG: hypothetical protein ACP5D2_02765 [Candidatus Nanoarchaeia archaeon]
MSFLTLLLWAFLIVICLTASIWIIRFLIKLFSGEAEGNSALGKIWSACCMATKSHW